MNLNDTDYFNKYLKYKSKYNTLKIQLAGGDCKKGQCKMVNGKWIDHEWNANRTSPHCKKCDCRKGLDYDRQK
jgi:hypothetical protein